MLAWQAATLLQPHLKKGRKITPAELLGEDDKATAGPLPGIFMDKESLVAAIKAQRAARARANGEDGPEE